MNDQFTGSDDELNARARRIDLAHQSDFSIGAAYVRPSLRTITGPDGEVMLEPKVMQVLVALSDPIGEILSRDDLIERCWEGRVVGDTSINRVISLLRGGLRQAAGDAIVVDNVPKVGYRIVVNSDAAGSQDDPPEGSGQSDAALRPAQNSEMDSARPNLTLIAVGIAVLCAILAAVSWMQPFRQGPVEEISVAMLPLEYSEAVDPLYAKGLESELRSYLARVGAMEVTASESARVLLEEGIQPAEIGRRLEVDYVWSGSLTTQADRVRLTTQLVRVDSGEIEWSEEIFSAPDLAQNIAVRMARDVAVALGRPVSASGDQLNVSAGDYRLYLTALGLIKGRGVEQREAAHEIMTQVTDRNPDFADGWAGLAKATFLYPVRGPTLQEEYREEALRLARYALTLDPDSVDALKVAGQLEEDPRRGLEMSKRAAQLDPGDAEAWFWLSINQRGSILLPEADGGPLRSAQRMLAIDPLWPATWRAPDAAAEFGRVDLAREMENHILAAAVTPSQRYLAEARLARYDGDLSAFFESAAKASSTQTPAERRYGVSSQIAIARALLGLPSAPFNKSEADPDYSLLIKVWNGDLPALSEFEDAGFGGADFWNSGDLVGEAMPLFLRDGREAELVALFEARFPAQSDYLAFAEMAQAQEYFIPQVSAYMAMAYQRNGREQDALRHIAAAEEQIARWKEADTGWLLPLMMELNLSAVTGDNQRAIEIVRMLPDYGWPYSVGHARADLVGLITGNALLDNIRELPEVREVLDPIEAKLARERTEALAAGL